MDADIAWLTPEQRGPASHLLCRVWRTQQELDRLQLSSRLRSVPDLIDQHVPPAAAVTQTARPAEEPAPPGRRREPACTGHLDERRAELIGRHGGCPWMLPGKVYNGGVIGLHEEIEDFYQYMSPTPSEHMMRRHVYNNIKRVIQGLWIHAKVFIFGSFETGLYLPTSDIDIVVMLENWDKCLELLRDALIHADICDPASIKVLDKAAVPIIKLTDRRTDVKVDISFNMKNGLVSAEQIKRYQARFPRLAQLVIPLKQFLLQRELNEVFTGGISSYSLILMTVGFLQTYEMRPYTTDDLGTLLIEFFELYGFKFNYLKTCIKVKDDRGFAPRSEVEEQFAGHSAHNSPLCIEDPHNATNDIGRSSYNMMKVKEAFKYAAQRLSSAVLSDAASCNPNNYRYGAAALTRDGN